MPADPSRSAPSRSRLSRAAWWGAGLLAVAFLVWQALTASGGTPDPTDAQNLSHGAVVTDSAVLVLREGLECILVLAAVLASMRGANGGYRRPVGVGAGVGFAASVATWFLAVWVLGMFRRQRAGPPGRDGAAGDRRAADRHELVLPQRLLDRLGLHTTPIAAVAACSTRPTTSRRQAAARARAARLHERLPRGLRDRPVPAEPAPGVRRRRRPRGRRDRPGFDRRRRRAHVPHAPQAPVQAHADHHRRDA